MRKGGGECGGVGGGVRVCSRAVSVRILKVLRSGARCLVLRGQHWD